MAAGKGQPRRRRRRRQRRRRRGRSVKRVAGNRRVRKASRSASQESDEDFVPDEEEESSWEGGDGGEDAEEEGEGTDREREGGREEWTRPRKRRRRGRVVEDEEDEGTDEEDWTPSRAGTHSEDETEVEESSEEQEEYTDEGEEDADEEEEDGEWIYPSRRSGISRLGPQEGRRSVRGSGGKLRRGGSSHPHGKIAGTRGREHFVQHSSSSHNGIRANDVNRSRSRKRRHGTGRESSIMQIGSSRPHAKTVGRTTGRHHFVQLSSSSHNGIGANDVNQRSSRRKQRHGAGRESIMQISSSSCDGEDGKGDADDDCHRRKRSIVRREGFMEFGSSSRDGEESEGMSQMRVHRKGKEPILDEGVSHGGKTKEGNIKDLCGICLTEGGGKVKRGILDCCDHYFCYRCIMEWAKVESRCPMCKQRFVKIVRPVNLTTGKSKAIHVPLRNQVYVPSEDEIRGYEDPYADVVCMECLEAGEERLLLLCDLCDAAAHTYCVGLGRRVPHGDWFCRSCQVSVPESSLDEDLTLVFGIDDEDSTVREIVATPEDQHLHAASDTSTTSSMVIRGPRRRARRRLLRRPTHQSSNSPIYPVSQTVSSLENQIVEPTGSADPQPSAQPTGTARTVPNQRLLQERIQSIHEGWEENGIGTKEFLLMKGTAISRSPSSTPDFLHGVTETVFQSPSRLVDRSKTLGDNNTRSQTQTGLSISTIPSLSSRQVAICKEEDDIAHAWTKFEDAKSMSGINSSVANLEKTEMSSSLLNRQGTCEVKQRAFTCEALTVLQSRPSVLFVGSQKLDYPDESAVKQSDLEHKPEMGHGVFHERSREYLAGSSSTNSAACLFAKRNEVSIKASGNYGSDVLPRKFEGGNYGEASYGSRSSEMLGGYAVAKSLRPQLFGGDRLVDFQYETDKNYSIHQCGFPFSADTFDAHNVPSEPKYGCITSYPSTQEANYLNKDECAYRLGKYTFEGADSYVHSDETVKIHEDSVEEQVVSQVAIRPICENASENSFGNSKTRQGKGVKDLIVRSVKTELWPIYLSKGLGREQFKEIARSATHALLTICGLERHVNMHFEFEILHCCHDDTGPTSDLCRSCFKAQVKVVVETMTRRISLSGA